MQTRTPGGIAAVGAGGLTALSSPLLGGISRFALSDNQLNQYHPHRNQHHQHHRHHRQYSPVLKRTSTSNKSLFHPLASTCESHFAPQSHRGICCLKLKGLSSSLQWSFFQSKFKGLPSDRRLLCAVPARSMTSPLASATAACCPSGSLSAISACPGRAKS